MNIICQTIAGSRLHGTAGPESDTDRKAVYLPDLRDLALGRAQATIQDKQNNREIFSLQEFLRLASEGQKIALEMLHTPSEFVEWTSPTWEELRNLRHRFHTKNITTFVGFANKMMTKYVTRGSRLANVRITIAAIEPYQGRELRLGQIWNNLPESPFSERKFNPRQKGTDKRVYKICERCLPATITVDYALHILRSLHDKFGNRVQQVADGDGKELKSFAHAWRAALQLKYLLETGNIPFPLPEAPFLREIKFGQNPNLQELGQRLKNLLDQISQLTHESQLPESVDSHFVDTLILKAYGLQS